MTTLKKTVSLIVQCLIAIVVLIFVGVFPILFLNLSFNGREFLQAFYQETVRVFTLDHLTYEGRFPLFPLIFQSYLDSLRVLGLGLLLACVIALLIAYVSILLFKKKIHYIKRLIEIFESVPDLMFILLVQMIVIFIYKKTGIRIAHVVTVREKTILLPVICMAVPISFYMAKVVIHYIEDELEKNYIILAKSMGFSFFHILNVHVLRNIIDGMIITSRTVFWTMLSTLLVVDYLFNMNGLMSTMLTGTDAFVIGCILIFIPFFILYRIYDWVSFDNRKDTY